MEAEQSNGYLLIKALRAVAGNFVSALGTVMMLNAELGLNPWSILHQGIALQTGLTFGQAAQLVGLTIIIFCAWHKFYPGLSTILNMYFFGAFVDILQATGLFFTPMTIVYKWLLLLGGNAVLALGCSIYLREQLGAGPKDGLMLLITQKIKKDVGMIRVTMEVIAVVVGVLLDGSFGWGTLVCALTFGPILRMFFKGFHYVASEAHQENLLETAHRFRKKCDDG